jgi:hypothetical protein
MGVRRKVNELCPDTFELVRSICNGSKHVETDHTHEIQFQAGSDWDRPPAFAEVTRTGISYLGDVFGGREARAGDRRFDLYGCVKALVLAFPTLMVTTRSTGNACEADNRDAFELSNYSSHIPRDVTPHRGFERCHIDQRSRPVHSGDNLAAGDQARQSALADRKEWRGVGTSPD